MQRAAGRYSGLNYIHTFKVESFFVASLTLSRHVFDDIITLLLFGSDWVKLPFNVTITCVGGLQRKKGFK